MYGVLLIALGMQAAAQTAPEDADNQFDRAVALHRAGDVLGAVSAYQLILSRHPARVDVRSNLGAALAQLGRFEEAVGEYKKALADSGGNPAIRFNLALAYYKAALYESAADELKLVAEAQPEMLQPVLLRADCFLRLGEFKRVIELLSPLQSRVGEDRAFAYMLGTALIHDKQIERGQVLIDRILKDGDSAEARIMLGAAHLLTNDHQSAVKEFERALELNPRLPTLNAFYGKALMYAGETERAATAFARELEINPNDFESNIYIGMLRKKEGRTDDALMYFRRAGQVRPGDLNAGYQIASIYLVSGKAAEAQQILEGVVKAAPDFIDARVLLAQAYYRLKRKEEGDRERAIVERLQAAEQEKQTAPNREPVVKQP
ncbi:MAG: tetratricopeptide repeat protein [Acidobacteria bacterium]|nr:tetratricopeptide repeat protein [Acidobacteriota bacterium]MCW5966911.1 tetratricopeptide repeat protein [Blastocatellales bacterium]